MGLLIEADVTYRGSMQHGVCGVYRVEWRIGRCIGVCGGVCACGREYVGVCVEGKVNLGGVEWQWEIVSLTKMIRLR